MTHTRKTHLSDVDITIFNQFLETNFNNRRYSDGYNWTRSTWMGGWNSYLGTVTAGKNATLTGLATLITGDANDWKLLAKKPEVKSGQIIFVEPLLCKFELMLRVKVVSATKKFLADFGNYQQNISMNDDSAKATNLFFDADKSPYTDCLGAIDSVMSKGIIDSTSTFEYNLLGINDVLSSLLKRKSSLREMLIGDSGWIQNYDDYFTHDSNGPFQAENVIKIASDKFWGQIGENYRQSVKS